MEIKNLNPLVINVYKKTIFYLKKNFSNKPDSDLSLKKAELDKEDEKIAGEYFKLIDANAGAREMQMYQLRKEKNNLHRDEANYRIIRNEQFISRLEKLDRLLESGNSENLDLYEDFIEAIKDEIVTLYKSKIQLIKQRNNFVSLCGIILNDQIMINLVRESLEEDRSWVKSVDDKSTEVTGYNEIKLDKLLLNRYNCQISNKSGVELKAEVNRVLGEIRFDRETTLGNIKNKFSLDYLSAIKEMDFKDLCDPDIVSLVERINFYAEKQQVNEQEVDSKRK